MKLECSNEADNSYKSIKKRNSALELLRIVCMFLIVMHHFAVHGNYDLGSHITSNNLWVQFLSLGGKLGINCFIMISGYFLINSSFKLKKLIKLVCEIWFYSVIFYLIFLFSGSFNFSFSMFINDLTPILNSRYGFATVYLVLYLLSPYLNKFLKSLTKNQYKKFLTITFILWSVIPTFTTIEFQYSDLIWYMIMYSFAAYVRLFPCNYFNKFKVNLSLAILSYIAIFLFAVVVDIIGSGNEFLFSHSTYFRGINKVPLFITSFTLFLAFKNMKIKYNKYINLVSATTFGIYLIHDNPYMRIFLWKKLFKCSKLLNNNYFIIYSIIIIISVFVVCSIIDKLRIMFIEKYFVKLLDNSNIYKEYINIKKRVKRGNTLLFAFLNGKGNES